MNYTPSLKNNDKKLLTAKIKKMQKQLQILVKLANKQEQTLSNYELETINMIDSLSKDRAINSEKLEEQSYQTNKKLYTLQNELDELIKEPSKYTEAQFEEAKKIISYCGYVAIKLANAKRQAY